jgi:hypothetical protein
MALQKRCKEKYMESMALEFFTVRQLRRWSEKGLLLNALPLSTGTHHFAAVTLAEAQVARALEQFLPLSSFDLNLNGAEDRTDIIRMLLAGKEVHIGDLTVRMRKQA